MRTLTPQQHENVTKALELIQSLPPEQVDLNTFGQSSCGTIACTLGHCGTQRHFHAQGLTWDNPLKRLELDGSGLYTPGTDRIFGKDSFMHLFSLVGDSPYDEIFQEEFPDLPVTTNCQENTKELAIFRLQQWLQSSTVTTEGS